MFSLPQLIVALPLALFWIPALAGRLGRSAASWSTAAIMAGSLVLLLSQSGAVFSGETLHGSMAWLPQAGLQASFRLDGLGLLFSLLILGIGLLVVLYAHYYLAEKDPVGRFYCYLLLFAAAMLGVVLSDNVILLVVFWELTSLSSFLLIGYWDYRSDARAGARMALTVTGAGGLCLLAGMLLLAQAAGSYELSDILQRRQQVQASPYYLPMLILFLLGVFTKSAQFPFHFWLPHAMAAPTPVSAYLHSATMVKAGIFLLARFYPVLSGTDAWFYIVATVGFVTFAFGAYAALFKHDLKGLLAYSTISHLGLITLLFGLQTPHSVVAAVFHIINHATFKASLFMAAGIIDHETGTRDMRKLGSLWKYMPYTGALALVASAAMAGVPLLNGFLSKEMFLAETLQVQAGGIWGVMIPVAAVIASVFSVAYSVRFVDDVFFRGELVGLDKEPHEPPVWMKVPVYLLVLLCLAVGIFPYYTVAPLLATAVGATLNGPLPEYSLAIWHGFNLPLVMSLFAMAGGAAVYFFLQRAYDLHRYVQSPFGGHWLYREALGYLLGFSSALTQRLENGSLQRSLGWTVITALILAASPFLAWEWTIGTRPLTAVNGIAVVIWIMLAAVTAAIVALHEQRLTALVLVGLVGLITTLAFVYLAAPDLALTQVSVEVVTIVLILLALYWLPQHTPREDGRRPSLRKVRDAIVAAAAGLGITAVTYAVLTRPFESLSAYYLDNSVPGGGGTNVVNVILVDFRGFDTFGEITVLALAALGIAALMANPLAARRTADGEGRAWARETHPLMLTSLTSVLLPLALTVAVYIFLRGHNLPGGGFVAGLVTGIALILLYIANGIDWAATRMRIEYPRVLGAGILIAGLTGVGSWFFGRPFLTSAHGHPHLPLLGDLPLASAMAFDLGVYLTVVGAVMLSLGSLGRAGRSSSGNAATTKET
ncbi:monovalent cation/H+ antiporter subunit A [Noviherbaspirillum sp. CPCC 100848]|uniref:Monovalent cation/H+ antiporter subunit A n=1 Tax=Noviherbaspirillum album TaxID=3080276 RepID=A0ABU6JI59_9BURK|nr:monovalent cation/H+ antiporter subunit A [Noviherbaspirillum sp. CPCC 100848]MEC4723362.1 monovalent cation/H+ antiporter subunit A [Noviherbaspirillum sp. CPCC 100848]